MAGAQLRCEKLLAAANPSRLLEDEEDAASASSSEDDDTSSTLSPTYMNTNKLNNQPIPRSLNIPKSRSSSTPWLFTPSQLSQLSPRVSQLDLVDNPSAPSRKYAHLNSPQGTHFFNFHEDQMFNVLYAHLSVLYH